MACAPRIVSEGVGAADCAAWAQLTARRARAHIRAGGRAARHRAGGQGAYSAELDAAARA
eukprot:7391171-Prymnesium_polylepis.1